MNSKLHICMCGKMGTILYNSMQDVERCLLDHSCSSTGQKLIHYISKILTKARVSSSGYTSGSLWFSNADNSTGETTSSMASRLTVREPSLAQIIFTLVHLREIGEGNSGYSAITAWLYINYHHMARPPPCTWPGFDTTRPLPTHNEQQQQKITSYVLLLLMKLTSTLSKPALISASNVNS